MDFSWDARGCYGERFERTTLILQMNDVPYRKRQIIALVCKMAMKDSREQLWPLSIQDVLNLVTELYSSKLKKKFYLSL